MNIKSFVVMGLIGGGVGVGVFVSQIDNKAVDILNVENEIVGQSLEATSGMTENNISSKAASLSMPPQVADVSEDVNKSEKTMSSSSSPDVAVQSDSSEPQFEVLGMVLTNDINDMDSDSISQEESAISNYLDSNNVIQRLNDGDFPKEEVENIKVLFAHLTKLRGENISRRLNDFANQIDLYEQNKSTGMYKLAAMNADEERVKNLKEVTQKAEKAEQIARQEMLDKAATEDKDIEAALNL